MGSTEGTSRPRKRCRTSNDADDTTAASGGKKARGRPRVDTQDATAADRRRTQIRLAQRAYRQRKETTISSLKQQSSQLYAIIDQMNKTFLHLNDSAIQSGLLQLNHELAKEFKEVAETFANSVKSANEQTLDSDEEELAETGPTRETQKPTTSAVAMQIQQSQTITPPRKEPSWGHTVMAHATERTRSPVEAAQPQSYFSHISSSSYNLPESGIQSTLVRRNQFTVGEVLDQPKTTNTSSHSQATDVQSRTQPPQSQQPLPFGFVDLPSREQSPFAPPYFFPINVPAMGAELPLTPRLSFKSATQLPVATLNTKILPPSSTHSYNEVTFARRLWRATLEAGFRLLSTNSTHPSILNFTFKLSLLYLTLDEMRDRFKMVLSRGVSEDLDWYATPFLHLGGAGTHYRRRDAHGKTIRLKNTWTVRQIGPLERRMIRLESVADGRIEDLEGVDLDGFDGEWFDAYDVQGYLEEQWHCRIDPRSSFAECLVEDENIVSDNETESPSLSRGSTASTKDFAVTPPIPHSFNAFEPSYGLDLSFDNPLPSTFVPAMPKQRLPELSFDQTLGLDLAPGLDMGFAGNSGYSTPGLNIVGESVQLAVARQRPKKVAWVDVSKFIENMIKQAVCLGRAPGYRRKDVDIAFREALIPAY